MKQSSLILYSTLVLLVSMVLACGTKKTSAPNEPPVEIRNKTKDEKGSTENSYLVSCPVVEKQRMIKGEQQKETDFFLQRSVQDYFIKFCESKVTRVEFENYLKNKTAQNKVLKAEIEYRQGDWDKCDDNRVASRTGAYVVINRLIDVGF